MNWTDIKQKAKVVLTCESLVVFRVMVHFFFGGSAHVDFGLGFDGEMAFLEGSFSRLAMVTVGPGHFKVVLDDFGSAACM